MKQRFSIAVLRQPKFIRRVMLSAAGLSRTLFSSLFGIVLNFILLHYKSPKILDTYVYAISIVNLLFIFANWGGKDYMILSLTRNQGRWRKISATVLGSRVLFSLGTAVVLLFIPGTPEVKAFIFLYLLIRSLLTYMDVLTVMTKKIHLLAIVDTVLYALFVLLVFFDGNVTDTGFYLAELLIFEGLRLLVCMLIFRQHLHFNFSLRASWHLARQALPFFMLSLTGFLSSKTDLYVLGLILHQPMMSTYFIILNMVSLCQVGYASLIGTYASNIYRFNGGSFRRFAVFSIYASVGMAVLSGLLIYLLCKFYYNIPFDLTFAILVVINLLLFNLVMMEVYSYNRLGLQRRLPVAFLMTGIFNLGLSAVLTSLFGMKGAFMSNTAGALASVLILRYRRIHATRRVSGNTRT